MFPHAVPGHAEPRRAARPGRLISARPRGPLWVMSRCSADFSAAPSETGADSTVGPGGGREGAGCAASAVSARAGQGRVSRQRYHYPCDALHRPAAGEPSLCLPGGSAQPAQRCGSGSGGQTREAFTSSRPGRPGRALTRPLGRSSLRPASCCCLRTKVEKKKKRLGSGTGRRRRSSWMEERPAGRQPRLEHAAVRSVWPIVSSAGAHRLCRPHVTLLCFA